MPSNLIRITTADGLAVTAEKSYLQTVEILKGLSLEQWMAFWAYRPTQLPCGNTIKLLKEEVR